MVLISIIIIVSTNSTPIGIILLLLDWIEDELELGVLELVILSNDNILIVDEQGDIGIFELLLNLVKVVNVHVVGVFEHIPDPRKLLCEWLNCIHEVEVVVI